MRLQKDNIDWHHSPALQSPMEHGNQAICNYEPTKTKTFTDSIIARTSVKCVVCLCAHCFSNWLHDASLMKLKASKRSINAKDRDGLEDKSDKD